MIRTARDLQSLDAALHCTQNFDDGVRREAEQTVRATLAFEEGIALFIEYLTLPGAPSHMRQLAGVLLKQQINIAWRSFSSNCRQSVLRASAAMLQTPEKTVRNTACLLLAAVANAAESDYLLVINTILRDGLADEALQEAHMACLRCLCFIAEDVTLDKLQRCLEMHSEKIVDIIQRRPSGPILRKAIQFLRVALLSYSNAYLAGDHDSSQTLAVFISSVIHVLAELLTTCNNIARIDERGVQLEVFRCLTIVIGAAPEMCAENFSSILASAWSCLTNALEGYMNAYVLPAGVQDPDIDERYGGYSSEGDRLDLQVLVVQVLELFCAIAEAPVDHIQRTLAGGVPQLLPVLHKYATLTRDQQVLWEENPNDFVAMCDDDNMDLSLRHTIADLVKLISTLGPALHPLLITAVTEQTVQLVQLRQMEAVTQQAHLDQLLCMESWLWLLAAAGRPYVQEVVQALKLSNRGKGSADLEPNPSQYVDVLKRAVQGCFHSQSAVLEGAAWSAICIFGALLDQDDIDYCLRFGTTVICEQENPLPTRLFACRAMGVLARFAEEKLGSIILTEAAPGIANIAQMCGDGTIHYPIETLTALLRLGANCMSADVADCAVHMALSVWTIYGSDPLCVEVCKELLVAVAKSDIGCATLVKIFLPQACMMLQNFSQQASPGLLDALAHVISKLAQSKRADTETSLLQSALPTLMSFIEHTDMSTLRQSALRCTANILALHGSSIPNVLPEDAIADLASRLLSTLEACFSHQNGVPDHAISPAVALFVHFLLHLGHFADPSSVTAATVAVLKRITSSTVPSAKSFMVLGFVHLFARNAVATMSLLKVRFGEQQGLGLILDEWSAIQDTISTLYTAKISCLAMFEVVTVLAQSSVNQPLAGKLFQIALRTTGEVMASGEEPDEQENEEEVDAEEEEDDDMFDTGGAPRQEGGRSPFVPADEYFLSDQLDAYLETGDIIPTADFGADTLVFSRMRDDPLYAIKPSERLCAIVGSLMVEDGQLPGWVRLTAQDQVLLRAILSEAGA